MKAKTHSGMKKRVKVRASGTMSLQKSCRNHLLSNKSKRQKKAYPGGMPLPPSRAKSIRKMLSN
ncbi:50S ribosomal protein L35 [Patescibacteria group bacterium]|nr:50S ribosomal protein L35 [Patescibacteria group bacterium]